MKGDKIIFNEINVTKALEQSLWACDKEHGIWVAQKAWWGCDVMQAVWINRHRAVEFIMPAQGEWNKTASWVEKNKNCI